MFIAGDSRPTRLGRKASDPSRGRNGKAEVECNEGKKAFCLASSVLRRSNLLSSHSKQFDLGLVPADTEWKSFIPSSCHSGLECQIWGKQRQNSPDFPTARGTINWQLTIHSLPTSPLASHGREGAESGLLVVSLDTHISCSYYSHVPIAGNS